MAPSWAAREAGDIAVIMELVMLETPRGLFNPRRKGKELVGWGEQRQQWQLSEPDREGARAGPGTFASEGVSQQLPVFRVPGGVRGFQPAAGCSWGFFHHAGTPQELFGWILAGMKQSGPCRPPWEEWSGGKDPASPLLTEGTHTGFWRAPGHTLGTLFC